MRMLESIRELDILAFNYFNKICRKERYLVNASRFASAVGDGPFYGIIGAGILLFGYWDIATLLTVGFIIERLAYKIFKALFKRNRPPEAIPGFRSVIAAPDRFSFPSGHASAAFLMASSLAYFFPAISVPLFGTAMCISISRVILGLHFPTDVLVGAILGVSIFWVSANGLMM